MKNAYIFDLDGTLGDTIPHCIDSFQYALETVTGQKCELESIVKYFGHSEDGIVKNIVPDKWEQCFDLYLDYYDKHHASATELFKGITDILCHLKENDHRLAMVTGKSSQSADITLKHFGITDYFEYIETGSPIGSIKPQCIEKIIGNWKIGKEHIYYVGDTSNDIIDSRKAGIKPIAVSWASTADHDVLRQHNPHMLFSEIEEFKNWIK